MSNSLAIADVTRALRKRLTDAEKQLTQADPPLAPDPDRPELTLTQITITTKSPDQVAKERLVESNKKNQVNLFLYQTVPNAAWRNTDVPGQLKPGETGVPPLPLNLYYLVTAYGAGDNEVLAHALLGWAMLVLHDFPLFAPQVIEQAERVRITLQPLNLEEMSKLWMIFQTPYHLSAVYQIAVVLIDSTRPPKAPLPVLKRGPDDQGVMSQPDPTSPFPTLEAVFAQKPGTAPLPADRQGLQPGARVGDVVTLRGLHLDGKGINAPNVTVRFRRPGADGVIELTPDPVRATEVRITLPAVPPGGASWVAGFYAVALVCRKTPGSAEVRSSNELPLALAPRVVPLPANSIPSAVPGTSDVTLTLSCTPDVLPTQTAVLLMGDRVVRALPHDTLTNKLRFDAKAVAPGDYFLRLRLDGVDSLVVADYDARPPRFDDDQKVTIP